MWAGEQRRPNERESLRSRKRKNERERRERERRERERRESERRERGRRERERGPHLRGPARALEPARALDHGHRGVRVIRDHHPPPPTRARPGKGRDPELRGAITARLRGT